MKTFKQAKQDHLATLATLGWAVSPHLKVPHATSPDGATRLYFKPQAVYACGGKGRLGDARSLHCDPRKVDTATLCREGADLAGFLA